MDECIPAALIWSKHLHLGDLRVYAILDRLDVWDTGLVQASHRRIAALYESTPAIIGRHIRHLIAAGALEIVYGGSFVPGAVTGDGNTYRLVHKQAATPAGRSTPTRAVDARPRAPSRRAPTRAISSPTENPPPTRANGFRPACPHPYPCACDDCQAWIAHHVAAPIEEAE